MSGRILTDTNVLVYAYDRSEPGKQERALDTLDRLATSQAGVVSVEVLAELYVTLTRKLSVPFEPGEAAIRVSNYLRSWAVVDLTGMIVLEAIRGARDHQMSYWDAQIWATAKLNQIPVVFSEDFSDGQVVEGVRFVNPFAPGFRVEDWLG
jgi:predicted nucleic acid-binding protein